MKKIKIIIKTCEDEERVFDVLESWLSEQLQEYEIEVEGNEKLKYKRMKND